MSTDTISITVPLEHNALTRASDMLHGLAQDCKHSGCDKEPVKVPDDNNGAVAEPEKPEPGSELAASTKVPDTTPQIVNSEVDTKGVPFNAQFCAKAQDPFYSSGPRTGQWKKGRGVDDAAYDNWYATELAQLTGQPGQEQTAAEPADEQVNTAAAFGGGEQPATAPTAPQDTGSFMGWISEKQAAGRLTQQDITDAYGQAGVTVADLFPPNTPEDIATRIAGIYNVLAVKAGA